MKKFIGVILSAAAVCLAGGLVWTGLGTQGVGGANQASQGDLSGEEEIAFSKAGESADDSAANDTAKKDLEENAGVQPDGSEGVYYLGDDLAEHDGYWYYRERDDLSIYRISCENPDGEPELIAPANDYWDDNAFLVTDEYFYRLEEVEGTVMMAQYTLDGTRLGELDVANSDDILFTGGSLYDSATVTVLPASGSSYEEYRLYQIKVEEGSKEEEILGAATHMSIVSDGKNVFYLPEGHEGLSALTVDGNEQNEVMSYGERSDSPLDEKRLNAQAVSGSDYYCADGKESICKIDLQSGKKETVLQSDSYAMQIAVVGNMLLYESRQEADDKLIDICGYNLDTGETTVYLSETAETSYGLQWYPGATRLYYTQTDTVADENTSGGQSSQASLWCMELDGTNPQILADAGGTGSWDFCFGSSAE